MEKESALSKILAPVSVADFVHFYFLKRPLLITGDAEKFQFLFDADSFKKNLDKVDHIRAVFPLLRQAVINISDMPDMLRAGASICVTGIQKGNTALSMAVDSIKHELNYRGKISFRSYLSRAGSGFDMHFDARAATTLQIGGKKRWWYKSNAEVIFPQENSPHTEYLVAKGFAPPLKHEMESVVLAPGDFLHLPAGAWHCAEAQEDSLSLNLAFDHKDASIATALLSFVSSKINAVASNRSPMFSLGDEPWFDPDIVEQTLSSIEQIHQLLNDLATDNTKMTEFLRNQFELHRQ